MMKAKHPYHKGFGLADLNLLSYFKHISPSWFVWFERPILSSRINRIGMALQLERKRPRVRWRNPKLRHAFVKIDNHDALIMRECDEDVFH